MKSPTEPPPTWTPTWLLGDYAWSTSAWRRALDTAADLSRRHTPLLGTRSLDVLHVASALTLGMTGLVTYDDRQAKLVRAVKLRLLQP